MLALSLQIMMPRETKHYMPCDVPFYKRNQERKAIKLFHEFQITETLIRPYHKIARVQLVIWFQVQTVITL